MSDPAKTADASVAATPDATAVNASWRAEPPATAGWRGLAARWLTRLLAPRLEAQRRFNAAQVQLDNQLLRYLDERMAIVQRHDDRLVSELVRRQDEIDERHRQLEHELVRHVQDLVTRIDVVLAESSRDRLALVHGLEEARARLARLEQGLRREG